MNGSSCMILKLKMINKALKVRLNCDCTLVMTLYTCTTRLACQMSRVLITPLVLYKRLVLASACTSACTIARTRILHDA